MTRLTEADQLDRPSFTLRMAVNRVHARMCVYVYVLLLNNIFPHKLRNIWWNAVWIVIRYTADLRGRTEKCERRPSGTI